MVVFLTRSSWRHVLVASSLKFVFLSFSTNDVNIDRVETHCHHFFSFENIRRTVKQLLSLLSTIGNIIDGVPGDSASLLPLAEQWCSECHWLVASSASSVSARAYAVGFHIARAKDELPKTAENGYEWNLEFITYLIISSVFFVLTYYSVVVVPLARYATLLNLARASWLTNDHICFSLLSRGEVILRQNLA